MSERACSEDLRVAIILLRSVKGWSRSRLAGELGMSVSTVSRYETGEIVPPEKVWDQIVHVLRVPPVWARRALTLIAAIRIAMEVFSPEEDDSERVLDEIAFQVTDRVRHIIREAAALLFGKSEDLPKLSQASQAVDPSQEAPEPDKPREKATNHETEKGNPPPGRGIGQDLEDFRSRRDAPGPFYRDWRRDIPL